MLAGDDSSLAGQDTIPLGFATTGWPERTLAAMHFGLLAIESCPGWPAAEMQVPGLSNERHENQTQDKQSTQNTLLKIAVSSTC